MKHWIVILALVVVAGCKPSKRLPDPYSGYEHSSPEHGYWQEVGTSDVNIRELHLHTKGFSVTYRPFETYRDYWGTYAVAPDRSSITLTMASGNQRPGFQQTTGAISMPDSDHLRISGIPLDGRRPDVSAFEFSKFHPKKADQAASANRAERGR